MKSGRSAGAITNTRGLFNGAAGHPAGKGDKSRITNDKAFRANLEEINWKDGKGSDRKKIVIKQGKRTTIIYK